MTSELISRNREKAEVYSGENLCQEKSKELLSKLNMPKGLLPLTDLIEVGFNEATGFVWLLQKNKTQHYFKPIAKKVSYANEITAFVTDRKMSKLTGVKSKEILIWITISDIYIDEANKEKITFATPAGLSRTFPVSAFEEEK